MAAARSAVAHAGPHTTNAMSHPSAATADPGSGTTRLGGDEKVDVGIRAHRPAFDGTEDGKALEPGGVAVL
jgi:hypothetical protein